VKKLGTMFFSTECFANGTLDMSGTTANLSSRSNLYRVFFYFTECFLFYQVHSINCYVYRVPDKNHSVQLQALGTLTHSGSDDVSQAKPNLPGPPRV
jgi:hypothetical protein